MSETLSRQSLPNLVHYYPPEPDLPRFLAAVFNEPDMPPQRWERSLAELLHARGYSPWAARRIVEHGGVYGIAGPGWLVREQDVAAIEAALPEASASGITVPIVPGLLPVTNFAQIQRITSLCGAMLPEGFIHDMQSAGDDEAAQFRVGVEHAARQLEGLLAEGLPGVHFYVLNRSEATSHVLNSVSLPRAGS